MERGLWEPPVCRWSLKPTVSNLQGAWGLGGEASMEETGGGREMAAEAANVGKKGLRRPRRVQCSGGPGMSVKKEAWRVRERCRGRKDGCGPRRVQWI